MIIADYSDGFYVRPVIIHEDLSISWVTKSGDWSGLTHTVIPERLSNRREAIVVDNLIVNMYV